MLTTTVRPSSGTAELAGFDVVRSPLEARSISSVVFQEPVVDRALSGRRNLDIHARLWRVPPADARDRVATLAGTLGLADLLDRPAGTYSGGERRRLEIARALVSRPRVLFLDEPTVGLDPRERIRFRNLLSRLAEGRVVLFSTHVVEDVEVACERVIVLARGRIVFDGPPTDLARAAEGRVWLTRLPTGAEAELARGALVVDQVPEATTVRSRILHGASPHATAESIEPTLEDGYLWLVREPAR